MSAPSPEREFLSDGKHWADVLGCDVRAGMTEIRRAANRRTNEALASLLGEALSKRLIEINEATAIANRVKYQPRRNRVGKFSPAATE